jgi:hypothetical protein
MSSTILFFSPRSAEEESKEECKVVNWQQLAKIFYSIDDVCEYFLWSGKRRKTCCDKGGTLIWHIISILFLWWKKSLILTIAVRFQSMWKSRKNFLSSIFYECCIFHFLTIFMKLIISKKNDFSNDSEIMLWFSKDFFTFRNYRVVFIICMNPCIFNYSRQTQRAFVGSFNHICLNKISRIFSCGSTLSRVN